MTFDDTTKFRRARVAEFRRMVGGGYQVRTQQHVVYLEDVAAFIWRQLDGTASIATLVPLIVGEFDVEPAIVRIDLNEFLEDLVTRGFAEVED